MNGFNREDETDTIVNLLIKRGAVTTVIIEHGGVKNTESVKAKQKAWTEILNEMENELTK